MLRIAVCDDNPSFIKKFVPILQAEFSNRNIEVDIENYTQGDLLLGHHLIRRFDVAFLDIDMPAISGFDVAQKLCECYNYCQVVFVTSHSELVYDSFKFRPLNFICKSNDLSFEAKIQEVLDQILEHHKQEAVIVLEDYESGRVSVPLREILYIQSNKHYVLYHIIGQEKPVTVRDSISRLEQLYSDKSFVRIHKKFLVNLRHIFNVDNNHMEVVFKQKFSLPMGKMYKYDVDTMLTEYLRRIR